MTKKITVSVSDELAEKIDARRDYLGNVSAIFQEAVTEKIRKKEEFEQRVKGDKSMGTIIERLRKEKVGARTDYFEKGKLDGLEWAKAAAYDELEYAANLGESGDLIDRSVGLQGGEYDIKRVVYNSVLRSYFSEIFESKPILRPGEDDDCFSDLTERWLDGWCQGVHEFWLEVEPHLRDS